MLKTFQDKVTFKILNITKGNLLGQEELDQKNQIFLTFEEIKKIMKRSASILGHINHHIEVLKLRMKTKKEKFL